MSYKIHIINELIDYTKHTHLFLLYEMIFFWFEKFAAKGRKLK